MYYKSQNISSQEKAINWPSISACIEMCSSLRLSIKSLLNLFILFSNRFERVYFTQSYIAKKLGIRRETANRLVRKLCEMGILVKEYRHLTSCNYYLSTIFNNLDVRNALKPLYWACKYLPITLLMSLGDEMKSLNSMIGVNQWNQRPYVEDSRYEKEDLAQPEEKCHTRYLDSKYISSDNSKNAKFKSYPTTLDETKLTFPDNELASKVEIVKSHFGIDKTGEELLRKASKSLTASCEANLRSSEGVAPKAQAEVSRANKSFEVNRANEDTLRSSRGSTISSKRPNHHIKELNLTEAGMIKLTAYPPAAIQAAYEAMRAHKGDVTQPFTFFSKLCFNYCKANSLKPDWGLCFNELRSRGYDKESVGIDLENPYLYYTQEEVAALYPEKPKTSSAFYPKKAVQEPPKYRAAAPPPKRYFDKHEEAARSREIQAAGLPSTGDAGLDNIFADIFASIIKDGTIPDQI